MNRFFCILILVFFQLGISTFHAVGNDVYLENTNNHKISIQFNPYLDDNFSDNLLGGNFNRMLWVGSLRYNNSKLTFSGFDLGFELHYQRRSSSVIDSYKVGAGPNIRRNYDVLPWLKLFGEFSAAVYNSRVKWLGNAIFPDQSKLGFDYFIAPGITIGNYQSRWGFDAFWKFSHEVIIDNRKNVFTYRITYRF